MQSIVKLKQFGFLIPVLVLAAAVLPVALANAAGTGGKPAAATSKSVKQLQKQVKALRQEIAAIQGQANSPRPPGGPAGGDLTGAFPNPVIAPNAVAGAEIASAAVDSPEIKDESVIGADLALNSVGTEEISPGNVASDDLGTESVGTRALKPVIAVIGSGVSVSAGAPHVTSVTCPDNRQLIAGGYGWTDKEPSTVLASAPSDTSPNSTWVVEGMVDAGSNNLYAWATCLAI